MKLNELKSLTKPQVDILEADDWIIETLALATVKDLTGYKGIGKITARNVINEAIELVNAQGLGDAKQFDIERYYQKTPAWKVVNDWTEEGMILHDIALASAGALAAVKGITFDQALKIISAAQDILNRANLYESRSMSAVGANVTVPAASAAFPVEWLSGVVEPPPMGARVRRNFERAKEAYKAENE